MKLGKNIYINEKASVVGKVELGENVNVWAGASIRADESEIIIGNNSNVQDNATLHCDKNCPIAIGNNVTIGHNAIVHGAIIEDNVIIGMGAIVLDKAVIGKNSIVGAGCLITGRKVIPENSIVIGNPYKILRETTSQEKEHILKNSEEYVSLAKEYLKK